MKIPKTAVLSKLSICPNGCTVLKDEITLGTEYRADLGIRLNATYRCGDCGTVQYNVPCVYLERDGAASGFLPIYMFYFK